MRRSNISAILNHISTAFIGSWWGIVFLVSLTAIRSAMWYQYDNDEMLHAQKAFWISTGLTPFADFFSIYTPVFHWLIVPTVRWSGAVFSTLAILRWEMLVLFSVTLVCTAVFLNRTVNKRTAAIFIGLILLDPFVTFAGAQIRPDTLMLTFFAAGLAVAAPGKRNGIGPALAAGLLWGLSGLTAMKILPAVAPVALWLVIREARRRNYRAALALTVGFAAPWIVFAGYFSLQGLLLPMATQLTVDIFHLSRAILYPVRYGFFHQPDNGFIFGVPGKPLTYYYVWVIPVIAAAGGSVAVFSALRRDRRDPKAGMLAALAVSMLFTYTALYVPTTLFIQYYVPSQWLFAMFAAIAADRLYRAAGIFKPAIAVAGIAVYALYAYGAGQANLSRSTVTAHAQEKRLERLWALVPPGEPVYPSVLFRPIVHPLSGYYMGDMPPAVRQQFSKPEDAFERSGLRILHLNDTDIGYHDASTQQYIRDHYHQPAGQNYLVRNGTGQ